MNSVYVNTPAKRAVLVGVAMTTALWYARPRYFFDPDGEPYCWDKMKEAGTTCQTTRLPWYLVVVASSVAVDLFF